MKMHFAQFVELGVLLPVLADSASLRCRGEGAWQEF